MDITKTKRSLKGKVIGEKTERDSVSCCGAASEMCREKVTPQIKVPVQFFPSHVAQI